MNIHLHSKKKNHSLDDSYPFVQERTLQGAESLCGRLPGSKESTSLPRQMTSSSLKYDFSSLSLSSNVICTLKDSFRDKRFDWRKPKTALHLCNGLYHGPKPRSQTFISPQSKHESNNNLDLTTIVHYHSTISTFRHKSYTEVEHDVELPKLELACTLFSNRQYNIYSYNRNVKRISTMQPTCVHSKSKHLVEHCLQMGQACPFSKESLARNPCHTTLCGLTHVWHYHLALIPVSLHRLVRDETDGVESLMISLIIKPPLSVVSKVINRKKEEGICQWETMQGSK